MTTTDRTAEWDRLRAAHLRPREERPESWARGVHHVALLSHDVERTIGFYQDLLGFPLTELFENRDYEGSTHFFFDIGNGNSLAFFDFPGLDLGDYAEVLGGLHHLAISVPPRGGRRGDPPDRHVAVLRRSRRRSHRAHLRSPRGDVRQRDRLIRAAGRIDATGGRGRRVRRRCDPSGPTTSST